SRKSWKKYRSCFFPKLSLLYVVFLTYFCVCRCLCVWICFCMALVLCMCVCVFRFKAAFLAPLLLYTRTDILSCHSVSFLTCFVAICQVRACLLFLASPFSVHH
uniref:Uncharacterized protein n=1 Tax=Monopterus albus TaxID=43700 RepID=A0A3Q3JPE9_MONAL